MSQRISSKTPFISNLKNPVCASSVRTCEDTLFYVKFRNLAVSIENLRTIFSQDKFFHEGQL